MFKDCVANIEYTIQYIGIQTEREGPSFLNIKPSINVY